MVVGEYYVGSAVAVDEARTLNLSEINSSKYVCVPDRALDNDYGAFYFVEKLTERDVLTQHVCYVGEIRRLETGDLVLNRRELTLQAGYCGLKVRRVLASGVRFCLEPIDLFLYRRKLILKIANCLGYILVIRASSVLKTAKLTLQG